MMIVKDSHSYGGYKIINDVPKEVFYFYFECDTIADLPAPTVYDSQNILLGQGCEAHIIDTNSMMMMKSDGTWTLQQAGSASYTKAEIDTMIDTINSTDAAQQTEIDYSINTGSKNKLHTLRASGTSATGLTYTLNSDGTYTLGGTTTADANISALCTLADLPSDFIGKNAILTGAIDNNIRLAVYNGNVQSPYIDAGNGVEFEITAEMLSNPYTVRLLVRNGTDCTGEVIKPMIRMSTITDGSFQPYAPTNRELYEMILSL